MQKQQQQQKQFHQNRVTVMSLKLIKEMNNEKLTRKEFLFLHLKNRPSTIKNQAKTPSNTDTDHCRTVHLLKMWKKNAERIV